MKRLIAVLLVLALCFPLAGCMSDFSIDDLLSAPALTKDQSAVLKALEEYNGGKTVLKYPTSGDRRSPIQFIDLDQDSVNEAVVFFSQPNADIYALLAVLKKTAEGAWNIVSVVTAPGTDVESISVIRVAETAGRFLLVEWSSTNSSEHQISAYHFSDGQLSLGFEEACSDILVCDLDGDGSKEFVYITPGSTFEPFRIKYVDLTNGTLAQVGESVLNENMMGSVGIASGTLADGREAVFVDENIGDKQLTEVFVLDSTGFGPVKLDAGFSIPEVSTRAIDAQPCRSAFSGSHFYIPSAQPPTDDVLQPDKWTYWYTVRGTVLEYAGATYISETYGVSVAVPDEWLSHVSVVTNPSEERAIEMYDTVSQDLLLRVKVLEIGEDAGSYIRDGFSLITQAGSYRYYVKLFGLTDDLPYIKSNFSIL